MPRKDPPTWPEVMAVLQAWLAANSPYFQPVKVTIAGYGKQRITLPFIVPPQPGNTE